jgi:SAM-dependent methyltransferase
MDFNNRINIGNISLACMEHKKPLLIAEGPSPSSNLMGCDSGCRFPVVNNIPRFVSSEMYTLSFGLQWNIFRKTQLDSYTGTTISKDRITRLMGGALNIKDKNVLEAGCGAGRFTEILLNAGANVFAVDLSSAVEANYDNCKQFRNYFVCQADIVNLPFLPEQFDIVICIGVIQHTPNPEKTIEALCSHVNPGGILVIDHYTYGYAVTPSRALLRSHLLQMPADFALQFCESLINIFWPLHELFWLNRNNPEFARLRPSFLQHSPVIDYHDAYPQLPPEILRSWALLDTHDTLTDVYKHLRSAEEIANHLSNCGMVNIEAIYAGNGVEARARKPAR